MYLELISMQSTFVGKQDLREEEVRDVPVPRQENCVSANKSHNERRRQSVIRSIRLQNARVRQRPAIESLYLARLVEAQERVAHYREVDKLGGCNQAHKPAQYYCGVLAKLQEREQRNDENHGDAQVGHTLLGALGQNLGCLAFERETEERARGTVDVGVACGEGGGEDSGVDNVREDFDSKSVHGDDVGGSGGSGLAIGECGFQLRVVIWHVDTDCQ